MAILVGDTLRVVAKMRDVNNSLIINRYFWRHTGSGNADESTVLTALETTISTYYGYLDPYMPTSLQPESLEVDLVQFANGKLVTISSVGNIAWTTWSGGTSSGERMPEGVCALVNLPTVIPRTQGRKYLGPLVEGANDGGSVGSGFLLGIINYFFFLLNDATWDSQTFTPGLMSKKAEQLAVFNSAVVPAVFGYQRRRKPGVGA